MARPLRIDIPDGIFHVTSRGLEQRPIVADGADRARWTDLLDRVARRRQWRVFAWTLLDNHCHIFLRVPHGDLSAGMHDLNAGYVTVFNRRHRRCGPLLQGRFKAILVEREYHYWELSRYVHLNPVRAGVVADPREYPWGSCRCYVRPHLAPDWLAWEEVLCQHGRSVRAAQREYWRFLQEGARHPPESPLRQTEGATLLGTAGFVERMKEWLEGKLPDREVPAARQLRRGASFEDVEAAVCAAYRVPASTLRARGRHGNEARAVAVYMARALTPAPVTEIAERFGGVVASAASNLVRQVSLRRKTDQPLDARLRTIELALTKNE